MRFIGIFIFCQILVIFPSKAVAQILTGPVANPVATRTNANLSNQSQSEEEIQNAETNTRDEELSEDPAGTIKTKDENIDKSQVVAEQIQQLTPAEDENNPEKTAKTEEPVEIQPIGIEYPKNDALVKK